MPQSFPPIINAKTKILIIGTMPGEASLMANEYYAFKHNAFWKIMAELLNQGADFTSYAQKTSCLLKNGLGLWDSLQFCEREGSLDSAICQEQPNDFYSLLKAYPKVKHLLFNGQKAFQFFRKYHKDLPAVYDYAVLPSTSPANATVSFQQKLQIWREALGTVSGPES